MLCCSFSTAAFAVGATPEYRLDRAAVDSACPPAGSINSACQIFSLLCWAHSVAEQCINIHSDQSRASGGRVWYGGVYMTVCVCVWGERWKDKQPELTTQAARCHPPPDWHSDTRSLCVSHSPSSFHTNVYTGRWHQPKEDVISVTLPLHPKNTAYPRRDSAHTISDQIC